MPILKLSTEYDQYYRPHATPRPAASLRKDARENKIPGAFQMTAKGDWWVDTITHDKIIAERIQMAQMERAASQAPESDISDEELALINEIQGKISDAA
ncbi:MAG: hypothetical protein ACRBBW_16145 [Cellvibrionaceae bacterium]